MDGIEIPETENSFRKPWFLWRILTCSANLAATYPTHATLLRIGGRVEFQQSQPAVVILNACPKPTLRETRARILREAGYYPASAGTAQEPGCLATNVICSAAIICQSFKPG